MGSMHFSDAPIELGPELRALLDQSELFVMEIDPETGGMLEMARLIGRYARLPEDVEFAELVSPAVYEELSNWSEKYDYDMEILTGLRPWYTALLVEQTSLEAQGFRAEYGMEEQFLGFASERGLGVEVLESAEEQMRILASSSVDAQAAFLEAALDASDADRLEFVDAYRSGDEDLMLEFMERDIRTNADREIHEKLVVVRNRNMAGRIQESVADGRTRFVLVGAAHLIGDDGIPALLRERGYSVRKMEATYRPASAALEQLTR